MLSGGQTIWTRIFGHFKFFSSQKSAAIQATTADLGLDNTPPSLIDADIPKTETLKTASSSNITTTDTTVPDVVFDPMITMMSAATAETQIAEVASSTASNQITEADTTKVEDAQTSATKSDAIDVATTEGLMTEGLTTEIVDTAPNKPETVDLDLNVDLVDLDLNVQVGKPTAYQSDIGEPLVIDAVEIAPLAEEVSDGTLAQRLSSVATSNAPKTAARRRNGKTEKSRNGKTEKSRNGKTGKNRPVTSKKPTKRRMSKSVLNARPSYPGRISALTRAAAPRTPLKAQIALVPKKSIPKRATINSRRLKPTTTTGQRLARAA